jgi:hypothetical protein
LRTRVEDGAHDEAKIFGGEDARQRIEKFSEGCTLAMRLGELADVDFAWARGERVRVQAVKVERLSFVEARGFARQDYSHPFCEALPMLNFDCNGVGDGAQARDKNARLKAAAT